MDYLNKIVRLRNGMVVGPLIELQDLGHWKYKLVGSLITPGWSNWWRADGSWNVDPLPSPYDIIDIWQEDEEDIKDFM